MDILADNGEVIGVCENDVCTCFDGYELVGTNECADVNECEENESSICGGPEAGICSNLAGSYKCYCNAGYHESKVSK